MNQQRSMIDLLSTSAATGRAGRVLVVLLAYHAERHIRGVLEHIPAELLNSRGVHFLVLDDASGDSGVDAALHWAAERDATNVTVLRNVNQGYGGNQKLGLRLAIDCSFDFVILLHGDGEHLPALLPDVIEAWRRTGSDVVLGTWMRSSASAHRGRMRTYKIVGNRILKRLQNLLTGEQLPEYHTGLRGYATAFLRTVPFEINTNDFHFDTEILLQACHARARVAELEIPTSYGDELGHVNSLRYAYNVIKASLQFGLHQKGMFCSLKYRNLDRTAYPDKTSLPYSSHRMALELIQSISPRRVLDVGCGSGFVARECEKAGARVTGLDKSPPPPDAMSEFISARLDEGECPVNLSDFDLVLLLDVIEHLNEPEQFLLNLRDSYQNARDAVSAPPPLILSTPNVGFVTVRLNLLLGKFPYAERGILDITHKRLFTRGSLVRMLEDCGYQIERVLPVPVPFDAVFGGRIGPPLTRLSRLLCGVWPRLFAFQFLVLCSPKPSARQLLTESEQLLIADEDFYSVLQSQPHATGENSEHVETPVRARSATVNQRRA